MDRSCKQKDGVSPSVEEKKGRNNCEKNVVIVPPRPPMPEFELLYMPNQAGSASAQQLSSPISPANQVVPQIPPVPGYDQAVPVLNLQHLVPPSDPPHVLESAEQMSADVVPQARQVLGNNPFFGLDLEEASPQPALAAIQVVPNGRAVPDESRSRSYSAPSRYLALSRDPNQTDKPHSLPTSPARQSHDSPQLGGGGRNFDSPGKPPATYSSPFEDSVEESQPPVAKKDAP